MPTLGERLDGLMQRFAFRSPTGQFRPARAAERSTTAPLRGELAYADPSRLFPGRQPFLTYNPSQLVGAKGLRLFDEMRRDDQIKAALAFKKTTCIATGWQITSPEGKPKDWPPTAFATWVLKHLDPTEVGTATLEADLYEILSALDYGFSVSEKIWAPIEAGEWKGHIGLSALKTRAPHFITFAQDQFGNLIDNGIVQVVNTQQYLPRDKFVLYSYQSEFSNPYGKSDLEAAYFSWWSKYNAQKWLSMLLEKLGIPPVFGLYNPSRYQQPGLLDDLKKILGNLQAATVGVIPRADKDALEFWTPELAGQATRVFMPALEYFNKAISRALLMPDLLGLTQTSGAGSFARAQVHFDVFLLVVDSIRKDLQQTVMQHQVVEPLLDLNFPGLDEYPTWEFLPLTDELRMQLLAQWTTLVTTGVVTNQPEDEVHVRKLMKFPDKNNPDAPPPSAKMYPPQAAANGGGGGGGGGKPPGGGGAPRLPQGGQDPVAFRTTTNGHTYDWDEGKHPRVPAGSAGGGEWAGGDGGNGHGTGQAHAALRIAGWRHRAVDPSGVYVSPQHPDETITVHPDGSWYHSGAWRDVSNVEETPQTLAHGTARELIDYLASLTHTRVHYAPDQARDERGRWSDEGGGGPTTDTRPWHQVKTVSEAYSRLTRGQRVALANTSQVATLLDRMATTIDVAKSAGREVKINLCDVSVPGTNLFCTDNKGIHRVEMPQFRGTPVPGSPAEGMPRTPTGKVDIAPAFAAHLQSQGIHVERTMVPASSLKATQDELSGGAVAGMMRAMERGTLPPESIFVSKDNYVIDGHHRWAATVGLAAKGDPNLMMPVQRINLPIMDVMVRAWAFTKAQGIGGKAIYRARDYYAPDQPRDEHGRWSDAGGGLYHETTPEAAQAIRATGFNIGDAATTNRSMDFGLPRAVFLQVNPSGTPTGIFGGHMLPVEIDPNLRLLDVNAQPFMIEDHLTPPTKAALTPLRTQYYAARTESLFGKTEAQKTAADAKSAQLVAASQRLVTKDLQAQGYDGVHYYDPLGGDDEMFDKAKSIDVIAVFDPTHVRVKRAYYSPDQPRDPQGSPTGGQWTSGKGGGGAPSPARTRVSGGTPFDTPAIVEARAKLAALPNEFGIASTHLIKSPERDALRAQLADKFFGAGASQQGHRADIVMGLPGAGKSTMLVNPLAQRYGALVIDNDDIKAELPESRGGLANGFVHEEAANIANQVLKHAIRHGDNVVLPILGKTEANLRATITRLQNHGYDVHLHYVDVPIEEAARRVVTRFESSGKFVDPAYLLSAVGNRPKQNFDKLKSEVTTYGRYTNEGGPRLVERSPGYGRSVSARRHDAGRDGERARRTHAGPERRSGRPEANADEGLGRVVARPDERYAPDQARGPAPRPHPFYSPDQPRVPAGSEAGGEFAPLGTTTEASKLSPKDRAKYEAALATYKVTPEAMQAEIEGRITAVPEILAAARHWYPDANAYARDLRGKADITLEQAVGVIAAISPQNPWERATQYGPSGNKPEAATVIQYFAAHAADGQSPRQMAEALHALYDPKPGGANADHHRGPGISAANDALEKAFSILQDGSQKNLQAQLGTLKTASFYNNILAPGQTRDVTIDGHMAKALVFAAAAGGHAMPKTGTGSAEAMMAARVWGSPGHVVTADAVRHVAAKLHESPDTVQAAYWLRVQKISPYPKATKVAKETAMIDVQQRDDHPPMLLTVDRTMPWGDGPPLSEDELDRRTLGTVRSQAEEA